jgi:hypothetical protein
VIADRGGTAGIGIGNGDRSPAHQQGRCEHANTCRKAQMRRNHHLLTPAKGPLASSRSFHCRKLDTRGQRSANHFYDALSTQGHETNDSELRLLAAVRWSIREQGGEPGTRQVDELLNERRERARM